MKPLLIAGALTIALTGCSFVGALPGVDRLSNLICRSERTKVDTHRGCYPDLTCPAFGC